MKNKIIIRVKASFLIILLSLNIICWDCPMGFCTCGNFNCSVENKSVRKEQESMHKKNCCSKEEAPQQTNNASKRQNSDACNQNIINFSKIDKLCSTVYAGSNHVFIAAFISSFYTTNLLSTPGVNINILNYCLRNHHPPIPDIRIAIHSFLI